jgi:2-hydroxychromene-2-carboxylate isomerase
MLDFYFDFSSPFAYLASERVETAAARAGADLRWRPMLLGAVFKALGTPNVPLFALSEARHSMYYKDMFRWAEVWDVPLVFPSRFPMNTVLPLRCFLAVEDAAGTASAVAFAHAVFRAFWAADRDISDPGVLGMLLEDVGVDPTPVLEVATTPGVKEALRTATARAIDAGVFGAPTFVVDERDLFWGQDRLELVERALMGWRP